MRSSKARDNGGQGHLLSPIYSKRVLSFLIIGLFLALGYLRIKGEEIRLGYKISQNRSEVRKLTKEINALNAEYVVLKRPSRIGKKALAYGFKFPTQDDIIYVDRAVLVGERERK